MGKHLEEVSRISMKALGIPVVDCVQARPSTAANRAVGRSHSHASHMPVTERTLTRNVTASRLLTPDSCVQPLSIQSPASHVIGPKAFLGHFPGGSLQGYSGVCRV